MDSPALGFSRAKAQVFEIGGNTYKVYTEHNGDHVEAHRVNVVFPPPSRLLILTQAQQAMVKATGCDIKQGSLIGDQAMVKAVLKCHTT